MQLKWFIGKQGKTPHILLFFLLTVSELVAHGKVLHEGRWWWFSYGSLLRVNFHFPVVFYWEIRKDAFYVVIAISDPGTQTTHRFCLFRRISLLDGNSTVSRGRQKSFSLAGDGPSPPRPSMMVALEFRNGRMHFWFGWSLFWRNQTYVRLPGSPGFPHLWARLAPLQRSCAWYRC